MPENRSKKLPHFSSDREVIEFFDTHDMGDYEDEMPEVNFDIELKRSHYLVSVDEHLMSKLLEIAKKQQISIEMLVDSWLQEKILTVES
ncbi:MAG: CopG family antitoxin [Spirulina sp.]